jgi:integrase
MSVHRARGGTGYEARWRENGRHRSATFRTKRQAEEAERLGRDRERARRHGLPFEQGPITYGELCDRYVGQHQAGARTVRTLRERLVYSRRAFGAVLVRELHSEEIGRWNAALRLSPTTRGHALRAMRQVLAAGVRWGYLPRNPAGPDAVRAPAPAATEVLPFESWAEVEATASAAGTYRPLVVFACATGLRPQEWQVLEWRDFDMAERRCRVLRTLQDGAVSSAGKTDGALRTVLLQERALMALRELPRPLDARQLVFPSPGGGIIDLSNFRRRVWRPALNAAGLEHRPPYQMRHTFATLALAAGAPIEWVAAQLGHRNIRITLKHYARFLPATDARALAALDSFEDTAVRAQDAYTLGVNGGDPV